MNRKQFFSLLTTLILAAIGVNWWLKKKLLVVHTHDSNSSIGHKLRDKNYTNPPQPNADEIKIDTPVIIVGGGIAGLSAARMLANKGIPYILLELGNECGGNSISGENKTSAYPWGAHYLPIPNLNQPELINFLEEINIIQGYDENKKPIYDEFALCSDPEERLFINKYWQEGIIPDFGLTQKDQEDFKRFLSLINNYKLAIGSDQKEAFCIPISYSSRDEEYLKLDKITFSDFLKTHQLDSKYLHWYLNYCCNDDFGTSLEKTSAWAGIHYFAARKGIAANAQAEDVLTWPQGNAFLVKGLKQKIENNIITQSLVTHVAELNPGVIWVRLYDAKKEQTRDLFCKQVIMATPQYINKKIVGDYPKIEAQFEYNPWLVANLTTRPLSTNKGIEICWDNVIYNSPSLGYINACHQSLNSKHSQYVLTYYLPLCKSSGKEERKKAFEKTNEEWSELILTDLAKAHPDIRENLIEMTIKIWGHAMVSPMPGVIWNVEKDKLKAHSKNIHYAHTDLSGISIFEEAFYQGIEAAKRVIDNY